MWPANIYRPRLPKDARTLGVPKLDPPLPDLLTPLDLPREDLVFIPPQFLGICDLPLDLPLDLPVHPPIHIVYLFYG